MSLLSKLKALLPKPSEKQRRERYEFLKAKISERHFAGFGGLVVDFKRKFDLVDIGSFKAPMYYAVINKDGHWCIFWDRKRLAQEIGVGGPLKPGEALLPDHGGRTKPDTDLSKIDEIQPLTELHPEKVTHDGTEEGTPEAKPAEGA